jgi:hypothetical protein
MISTGEYPGYARVAEQRVAVSKIHTPDGAYDWAYRNLAHIHPADYTDGTWPTWVAAASIAADTRLRAISRATAAGNAAYTRFPSSI